MLSLMLKRIPIHRFRWLYLIVSLSPNYFRYTYCILLPFLIYPQNIGISSRFQVVSRWFPVSRHQLAFSSGTFSPRATLMAPYRSTGLYHVLFRNKDPGVVQKISSCYTLWRFAMHKVGFQGRKKVRWKLQSVTPVTETVVGHGSHAHAVFMAMSQKTQIKESTTQGRFVKTWHPSCEADEPTLDVDGAPTIWSQPGLRYAGAGNTGEVEFSNKWTIQIYPDLRWWSNDCNIGPTNFNTLPPLLIVDILAAQAPAVVSHWPHGWWNRLGVKSTNHQSLNHPKIMTRQLKHAVYWVYCIAIRSVINWRMELGADCWKSQKARTFQGINQQHFVMTSFAIIIRTSLNDNQQLDSWSQKDTNFAHP